MSEFTHKGWFGICPVYLADLDGDGAIVEPRSALLWPLMRLSEAFMGLAILVCSAIYEDYEPVFAIRVTGEL